MSAALTFTILVVFAVVVGVAGSQRIRSDFDARLDSAAANLAATLEVTFQVSTDSIRCRPSFDGYDAPERPRIRVILEGGRVLCENDAAQDARTRGDPIVAGGYDVSRRSIGRLDEFGEGQEISGFNEDIIDNVLGRRAALEYARPAGQIGDSQRNLWVFLAAGVLLGTALALLAGVTIARRAMSPVAELTAAAAEIERTGDPRAQLPAPAAEDEVAELARTLDRMLQSLSGARADLEAVLDRQRGFVADASHELRTPLTSIMANLELLVETLQGEDEEAAQAALRSSRRMQRLVGDLLLLARSDIGRQTEHGDVDLAAVAVEAAAEAQAATGGREVELSADPVTVAGSRDELHRLALNLIENALRHSPDDASVMVTVRDRGGEAELVVADEGPGVAPEMRDRLFERFVSAAGDQGGGTGLGLAIVKAVAESHGGTVALDEGGAPGARFVVRLPRLPAAP